MKSRVAQDGVVGPDEAVRGVGNLTSELLHALRNPVAAFKTSVELLLAGTTDPGDREALERVIRNELVKLNDLLGRCNELTQLSALTLGQHDLVAIVRGRLEAHRHELDAAGLKLEVSSPNGPILIAADDAQLGHVIDALMSNAMEASSSGTTIRVSVEASSGFATLTVADRGKGISPTALPNVFRLFYTTRKGASGMGLPLARQIVTAHGGTIAIESEPDKGTTVTVRLPIASA